VNTGPKVGGEMLALKRVIKNERRAVCIALWRISFSASYIDSKLSYNSHYDSLPKFWCEKLAENFRGKFSLLETNECKNMFQIKKGT
jgi:hypothetical protein